MPDDSEKQVPLSEMAETTDLPPDLELQDDYQSMVQGTGDGVANAPEQAVVAAPAQDTPETEERQVKIACHNCGQKVDLTGLDAFSSVICPSCGVELTVPKWFGNYLLEEVCGIGGMATVYRALDVVLNREVAIKVLKEDLSSNTAVGEVFLHEARAAATITHASVVPIYTLGVQDGQNYIVMQYMGGGSLEMVMKEYSEPLPVANVVEWIRDVASGLECASRNNIIHHDVKPANIMLDSEGKAKIGDFGIAQIASQEKEVKSPFRSWVSPDYVSPEKLQTGNEDERGDIYSLGATFYHLITGFTPFNNPDLDELLRARLVSTPMAPCLHRKDVPKKISDLILAMLSVAPEKRPTYQAIVKELDQYLNDPDKFSTPKKIGLKKTPPQKGGPVPPPGVRNKMPRTAGKTPHKVNAENPGQAKKTKKKNLILTLSTILFNVLLLFVSILILIYILDSFRRIDWMTEYLPRFMQERKKSTEPEAALNKQLIHSFQSGYPNDVFSSSDEFLRDPSKENRMQAALQVAYAAYLNNRNDAPEYCAGMLESYEKNLSYCDKIVFEDNLLVIKYLANGFETPEEVYSAVRFQKNGTPRCGSDFDAKLKLAIFFRLFYKNVPSSEEQMKNCLGDVKLALSKLQTTPNWLYGAFNDRYPYWEQVITKNTGDKEGIEPLFASLIKTPSQKWDFKEPEKKRRHSNEKTTIGPPQPQPQEQKKPKAQQNKQRKTLSDDPDMMRKSKMMANVAKLDIKKDFTPSGVDRNEGFENFDMQALIWSLEAEQARLKRPHLKYPFRFFGKGAKSLELQEKYLSSLSEKDAAQEKEFIARIWASFEPMLKREFMFKTVEEPFDLKNTPFVFNKGVRFKIVAGQTADNPYILRIQRPDGVFMDCSLEDVPFEAAVLLFRAYAKERNGYTLPKINNKDAAARHALRVEMHERAAAYMNLALLYAWYNKPEDSYDALTRAVGESMDIPNVQDIKKFLLPKKNKEPQESPKANK